MIHWNDTTCWASGATLIADGQKVVTCGSKISAIEQVGADRLVIWLNGGNHLVVDRGWNTCYEIPVNAAEIRSRVADGLVAIAVGNRGQTHNLQTGSMVKTWDTSEEIALLAVDTDNLVMVGYRNEEVTINTDGQRQMVFQSAEPPKGVLCSSIGCIVWTPAACGSVGVEGTQVSQLNWGSIGSIEPGEERGFDLLVTASTEPYQFIVHSETADCHNAIGWVNAITSKGEIPYFKGGLAYNCWHTLYEDRHAEGGSTPCYELQPAPPDAKLLAVTWCGSGFWARKPGEVREWLLAG